MKTHIIDYKDLQSNSLFDTLKTKQNILVQIFCGNGKNVLVDAAKTIKRYLPQSVIIGTTTDGEIFNATIKTYSTTISISEFDNTVVIGASVCDNDSYKNGIDLANKLITDNTKLLILFTDGSTSNGELFLKGVEHVNRKIMVCGGMAADNGNLIRTYVCSGDNILEEGAVGVSLNSNLLNVDNYYKFDWTPIGIEHTIDEIKNNRVYKISGMTSVDFYKKYLGDEVEKALPKTGIEFPLIAERNGLQVARAVLGKHSDGSLSFAGNFNVGDKVRLGFGNARMILKKTHESYSELSNQNAQSFFVYSCMARRRYIPDLIHTEIEPFVKIAPTVGFFTYGEFYHHAGYNELLNQTFTVVGLCECEFSGEIVVNSKKNKIVDGLDEYITIGALANLIDQSAQDYEIQQANLQQEKFYSQKLLKSQDLFIKHAVHETNTPLSVIMSNIELFEMEFGKNKYLSNIEVAMKNVFNIFDDLSYLIKNETISYPKCSIDLVDFLRIRLEFFDIVAKKEKLDMIYKSELPSFIIYFNETKLQRILDNNITNAIKYTKPNKKIHVTLNLSDVGTCTVTFKSKSSKIKNLDKVFQQFYRENETQKGFGLGLNLVKEICESEDIPINVISNQDYTSFSYIFKEKII